jgi:hypothetical protein
MLLRLLAVALLATTEALAVTRRSLAGALALAPALAVNTARAKEGTNTKDGVTFKQVRPIQFIAALGDPAAGSGGGATDWGIWRKDPGPRGVRLQGYDNLKKQGGKAPSGWAFDEKDWWLEEHGLIMENVDPLPAGKYVVTGDRGVTNVLDIDQKGAWSLADKATLADVTHGPCRAGRYTGSSCSPSSVDAQAFPIKSGGIMPAVSGCAKQDYAVLFILGVEDLS